MRKPTELQKLKLLISKSEYSFTVKILKENIVQDVELSSDCDTLILNEEEVHQLLPHVAQFAELTRHRHTFRTEEDIKQLKEITAEAFGVDDLGELVSKSRVGNIVMARQLIVSILRWCNYGSLHKIAFVVRKDHATVIHSERKITDMLKTKDPVYFLAMVKVLDHYGLHDKYTL